LSALTSATDGTSAITITNDRLRRPTSVTVSGDTGATTTYAYSFTAPTRTDAVGTTTMVTDPFGRVTSLTPPGFGAFTWAYGGDGAPTTAAAPNGNSTALAYDPLGRLLTKVTGSRASYAYAYNRSGSRLSEASTISGDPGNGTATFGYDALGRLTSYSLPGIRSMTDTWQAVPNRDLLTIDGVPTSQAFDAANRPSGNGYAFDADGRLTARPGSSGGNLEWDSLGRLVRVRTSQGGPVVAAYSYDALDRLRTVERGSSRLRFRYAGTTTAITGLVDDVAGTVIRHVVPAPDGTVLADRTGAGSDPRTYGSNGHHDVTWLAAASGAVSATLRSDPWGTVVRSSGTLPDWRFQGNWYDTSTDLAWAVARWYSPSLGSFVSEDALLGSPETPASRHLLAYAEGDPVGGWDPGGRGSVRVSFDRAGDGAGFDEMRLRVEATVFERKQIAGRLESTAARYTGPTGAWWRPRWLIATFAATRFGWSSGQTIAAGVSEHHLQVWLSLMNRSSGTLLRTWTLVHVTQRCVGTALQLVICSPSQWADDLDGHAFRVVYLSTSGSAIRNADRYSLIVEAAILAGTAAGQATTRLTISGMSGSIRW
jgi:RHS repeat-associated protein